MTTSIVYVEDDADNFRLVKRLLEATERYAVSGAVDGLSGLKLITQCPPDLALIDLDLPGINGFELARRLRTEPQLAKIPLIAISAGVLAGQRRRALDAGFSAFVEKPFDIQRFRELIEATLQSWQSDNDAR